VLMMAGLIEVLSEMHLEVKFDVIALLPLLATIVVRTVSLFYAQVIPPLLGQPY
jgi:hypothetical protein